MHRRRTLHLWLIVACAPAIGTGSFGSTVALAQTAAPPDWRGLEAETLRHFQAILRIDTSQDEEGIAEYLTQVLEQEGFPPRCTGSSPIAPTWWPASKATARSDRC